MPRVAPTIDLDPPTRAELERLARAPSTPQAVALRARLVLAAAQGLSNQQIAATFHLTPNTVGKWRTRFARFGVAGLTDFQHPGRPRKYGPEVGEKLNDLLRRPPPAGRERWTVSGLARRLRVPRSTAYAMLVANVKSHRWPARRKPRH